MELNQFHTKYKTALTELEKTLDNYLQGLWYKYDYLEFGQRTVISLEYFNGRVVAEVRFAGRSELKIDFEEINDTIILKAICRYDTLSGAYKDDVLRLQFNAQGKTEKEMVALNIEELSKECIDTSKKITALQSKKQKIINEINELGKVGKN